MDDNTGYIEQLKYLQSQQQQHQEQNEVPSWVLDQYNKEHLTQEQIWRLQQEQLNKWLYEKRDTDWEQGYRQQRNQTNAYNQTFQPYKGVIMSIKERFTMAKKRWESNWMYPLADGAVIGMIICYFLIR